MTVNYRDDSKNYVIGQFHACEIHWREINSFPKKLWYRYWLCKIRTTSLKFWDWRTEGIDKTFYNVAVYVLHTIVNNMMASSGTRWRHLAVHLLQYLRPWLSLKSSFRTFKMPSLYPLPYLRLGNEIVNIADVRKMIEKDVFRLVTSVGQRKNSASQWGIETQTFRFRAPMPYYRVTETPRWARSITNFI